MKMDDVELIQTLSEAMMHVSTAYSNLKCNDFAIDERNIKKNICKELDKALGDMACILYFNTDI